VRRRRHFRRDHREAPAEPGHERSRQHRSVRWTSTGSIVALGLASGVSIDTIFDLYSSEQACSQIFQPYLPQADQTRLIEDVEAGRRRAPR
jgi:hypothetical protein